MSKSARRPQRIFSVVMWGLSIIFAGFLIGLGSLVIRDLPQVDRSVTVEQFVDQDAMAKVNTEQAKLRIDLSQVSRDIEDAQSDLTEARADYGSAKASFENWLATRTATQSSAQNPEVISRTRSVEALKTAERAAQRRLSDISERQTQMQRASEDLNKSRKTLNDAARPAYKKAMRGRELRVFLFRLALTLPLLLVGAWMIAKKRDSAYWPLYRGFILFALFAFFVELVPHLPSYGGYVRYIVGILLVVAAGHFIIRGMRKYMARKQAEEARSEGERRQSIEYETALKKIAAKTCPGCDRSIVTRDGIDTDFCVHCGIRLQTQCGSCGERNVSFHKFCLSCGTPSETANLAS